MTETKQIHKIKPQGESFADLAEELFLWAKEETFPKNVSADAARILQAQRQRLREKGLEMEYAMTSQDFFRMQENNIPFFCIGCVKEILYSGQTGDGRISF